MNVFCQDKHAILSGVVVWYLLTGTVYYRSISNTAAPEALLKANSLQKPLVFSVYQVLSHDQRCCEVFLMCGYAKDGGWQ